MTIDKDQETWPDKKKHKSLFSKSENMFFFSKSFEMYFFQASSIQNQKEEKQR